MLRINCAVAAGMALLIDSLSPHGAAAKIVTLSMVVTIDQVSPADAGRYKIGKLDYVRVSYDDTRIDMASHMVRVAELSHFLPNGQWGPIKEDEAPASALDVTTDKLDFIGSVVHGGHPILAVFEHATSRMAMLARPDFQVLIAGHYIINPRPLTAADIAAPPASAASN